MQAYTDDLQKIGRHLAELEEEQDCVTRKRNQLHDKENTSRYQANSYRQTAYDLEHTIARSNAEFQSLKARADATNRQQTRGEAYAQ
jgi:uncharacterized coiled-coil DUF342 family protein